MTKRSTLRSLTVALALAPLGLSCASSAPPPATTIEPPAPGSQPAPKDDSTFVLSRTPAKKAAEPNAPVHINEQWWGFRAEFLKTTEAKVKERDADVSERQAPTEFWDLQTSIETVSIWGTFCNECHGGRRRTDDALKMPPPTANWGRGEGLFFGARRPYSEIFKVISNGKIEKESSRWKMPAWKGRLSKEQIWALIYFIEFQSGGIEGRFPPSLYPRGQNVE
jgi:mono/diheme cytochrome c family protein